MPLISVIIPLYNKESVIKQTIQSVLNQSFQSFEIVVVNDGSTDRSMEVVKKIHNNHIRLIEQKNNGPAAARNTGVKASKGDWIIFLDADDELLPDALQIYADFVKENPNVDVIDCGQKIKHGNKVSTISHSLEGLSKKPYRDWFFNRIGPGSNHTLFKKNIMLQYPYDSKLRRFEDAELLIRMLQTAKIFSSRIPTSIVHTEFSSASKKRKNISEDYAGHLSFTGKTFWARMSVYRLFIENRELYPDEMHKLYPSWYWRYDLLLLYKILNHFK